MEKKWEKEGNWKKQKKQKKMVSSPSREVILTYLHPL